MDRILGFTKDADGDIPSLTQLQQASMLPHSDMLRTIASAFAGETSVPLNSLGIVTDQPASAEAIRAAEHDLLIDVMHENKLVLGPAAVQVLNLAVMGRDKLKAPPPDAWRVSAVFADPEFRSTTARADGVVKIASVWDQVKASEVLLGELFDQDTVRAVLDEERNRAGQETLRQLLTGTPPTEAPPEPQEAPTQA